MRGHMSIAATVVTALTCTVLLAEAKVTRETVPTLESRVAQAQPPVSTQRSVKLTEEDRHTIREIILKETKVDKAPGNISISIGDPVSQGVTLQPIPDDVTRKVPQLKTDSFFVKSDNEIVIVDSKDRTVADIVKSKD